MTDGMEPSYSESEYTREEVEANEARTSINEDATTPTGMEVHLDASEPEPTFEGEAQPYASEQEMQAAFDAETEAGDLRIYVDEDYRLEQEARMEASMYVDDFGISRFDPEKAQALIDQQKRAQKLSEAEKQRRARLGGDYSELKISDTQEAKAKEKANLRGFESEAELERAVSDPRYEQIPSYRRKVDARMAATDWLNSWGQGW